ncbi:ATP-binding protein [Candidatus Igneacidithiobacillus taiwanensis]|uniref:ATP-binding protein n=1 Tax=Candidatus Igneacidithiobacillus taiwanensis TaxID=1945924 RepID=UPI0028962EE6|nr:ATP-binding protein [Candidatus Igneacidithiobacillus taiwanensis]
MLPQPEAGVERTLGEEHRLPVPRLLARRVGKAIQDYRMIRPGDRVLLALSGGKDSLSLLALLAQMQRHSKLSFSLGVATVDPQSPDFEPEPLGDHVRGLGLPWFWERQDIFGRAQKHLGRPSYCSFCARMRRGVLYQCARREGYNVVALGQHLDDFAESFFMSMFYNGELRTMKAHYRVREGDLRVIRPLVYCRERQTRAYAEGQGLPIIIENCPACFRHPTERQRMKELLAEQEARDPRLFKQLLHAMQPLMAREVPA